MLRKLFCYIVIISYLLLCQGCLLPLLEGIGIEATLARSFARSLAISNTERAALTMAGRSLFPEFSGLGQVVELRALKVSVARGANPRLFLTRNGRTMLFGEVEGRNIINVLNGQKIRLNTNVYYTKTDAVNVFKGTNRAELMGRIRESGQLLLKLEEVPGGMYKVMIVEDGMIGFVEAAQIGLLIAASGIASDPGLIPCGYCKQTGVEACTVCQQKKSIRCESCKGEKFQKCTFCVGEGTIACRICNGNGNYSCEGCNGNKRNVCQECNKNGKWVCKTCFGVGWLICEACFSTGYRKCSHCDGYMFQIK